MDLTGTSTLQPPRRPLDSPTSERPAKRSKGKGRERYISLDDDQDDDDQHEEQDLSTAKTDLRHKSPTQSGSLSQAKCVICLDSPTDLVATPCGTFLSPTLSGVN